MGVRLASIDVGSNAIRMSIGEHSRGKIEILKNYRVPIRLGKDTFSSGIIQDKTIEALLGAFIEFQRLILKNKVKFYKAIATSALRDAKNSEEVIDLIYTTSHIRLDLISGKEEAKLVHLAVSHVENISKKKALLVDIGGGSVEFIISSHGSVRKGMSFPLGTVRLLQTAQKEKPIFLKKFLENEIKKNISEITAYTKFFQSPGDQKILIGTGGNVKALNKISNQLFKDSKKDEISYFELDLLEKIIFGFSFKERIEKLNLKKDRADVILPALMTLKIVMETFNFTKLKCPDIGLKDGILIKISEKH